MDYTGNTNVNTTTRDYLVGKAIDTVLNYSPASLFFLANQKPWYGMQMKFPIKYEKSTQGTWFTGLNKFSTIDTANFVNMAFNPTGRENPVVISQMEVDLNATQPAANLVARKTASAAQDMAEDVATSFHTLQAGDAFLSLIDACDDATIGATSYGGLSRTTYPTLAGNYTAIGGNITLAGMRSGLSESIHGKDTPNLIITSKAVWGYLEKLFTPTMVNQVMSLQTIGYPKFAGADANGMPKIMAPGMSVTGIQGFNSLVWSGIPIVADEATPSGYLYMLNTNDIAFYGLKTTKKGYTPVQFTSDTLEGTYNIPVTTGFSFSGFNTPIDQYGEVGHILLMGNLICRNPRNQSVLVTITGS